MFTAYIPCPSGGCLMASDVGYGYGWFIADQGGHRYDYHWGRIDGFLASNGIYPQDGVVVIMLSNLETTDTWGISVQLGSIALGTATSKSKNVTSKSKRSAKSRRKD